MELKDFIKNVIVEISLGIEGAIDELEDKDVFVNPSLVMENNGFRVIHSTRGNRSVQNIEFHVGIEINSESGSKGGIGVMSGIFNAGGAVDSKSGEKSINNISFNIPVSFPTTTIDKKPIIRSTNLI